ncbi:MAG: carbohydrate ABC transporter permease, partial [Candidatus Scatosoma sp.]
MTKQMTVLLCILSVIALLIVSGIVGAKAEERIGRKKLDTGIGAAEERFLSFSKKYRRVGGRVLAYGILTLTCLSCLFPFLWMIASSLKTPAEVNNAMELVFFPAIPQFSNYAKAWESIDILRGFTNTMTIEIATIPVCVFMSAMEAFAFSKMYMKHKTANLLILLSGLMIPYVSVVLPLYKVYYKIGFINTFWPLILPSLFGSVSQMFFYIQYQKGIPDAMFESG